jgi:hypothetical protein
MQNISLDHYPVKKIFYACFSIFSVMGLFIQYIFSTSIVEAESIYSRRTASPPENTVYLPVVMKTLPDAKKLNLPYFGDQVVLYHQSAISWFGKVDGNQNYTDMRLGYNSEHIVIRVSTFDRFLWYDQTPSIADLTSWDSVSVYIDKNGNTGNNLDSDNYHFVGQLNWYGDRANYQAAYQGSSSGYVITPLAFQTYSGWSGNAPNDMTEDRGYQLYFFIPFTSLGLSGPPSANSTWGFSVSVHDRDAAGLTFQEKHWSPNFNSQRSETWGQISFSIPTFTQPATPPVQTITLQEGINGITVSDGVVGGNTLCGSGLDFWTGWGNYTYSAPRDMNVQNQGNVDDWPCFSKIFMTFPLTNLLPGKVIISATITLHQSGQSTGFPTDPPEAMDSLIQVFEVGTDWSENTLSWNNGPEPMENVSQTWVGPVTVAGVSRTWDVSRVVTRAYQGNKPLRVVFYSADAYGPHGKYFFSSHAEPYLRPSLTIILGEP